MVSVVGSLLIMGLLAAMSAHIAHRDALPASTGPLPTRGERTLSIQTDVERRERAVSRDAARDSGVSPRAGVSREELRQYRAANDRLQRQADRRAQAAAAARRWVLPLRSYRLTARFGQGSGLWTSAHTGLDFAAPTGTTIRSVTAGTVRSAGYAGSYGLRTVVRATTGEELWYCHQSRLDVSPGDTVAAGQPIGAVGATGNVTGSHLHLEVRSNDIPGDPETALRKRGVSP